MKIVSNTSPLVALNHVGELDLLRGVFGSVIVIPPAVQQELGSRSLPKWISVRVLEERTAVRIVQASLGAGESEAIALAVEIGADLILLDDKAARRLAASVGLSVIGTLGVLLRAKEVGLIPSIASKIEALRSLPFRIAPSLHDLVLRAAGEQMH